ncbi:Superoxide dismutase [Mn] 3.1 [Carex littledalei]|uniref:Superoxide dismutase n=1 Tax=Carex littledalei TaxID=544730 RepID=A0A833VHL0_9POAL|nr:Superoxide dismutase [Mn] 3.1 [Carex littledalei]
MLGTLSNQRGICEYEALEPVISGEIIRLHHLKHHQTYLTNYITALELLDSAIEKGDASAVVGLQLAIKFNGGGHVNHSIFWKNLKPISAGGGEPSHRKLGWQIDTDFGSFEALISKMNAEGAALQGSGWVLKLEIEILRASNWKGILRFLEGMEVGIVLDDGTGTNLHVGTWLDHKVITGTKVTWLENFTLQNTSLYGKYWMAASREKSKINGLISSPSNVNVHDHSCSSAWESFLERRTRMECSEK